MIPDNLPDKAKNICETHQKVLAALTDEQEADAEEEHEYACDEVSMWWIAQEYLRLHAENTRLQSLLDASGYLDGE